MFQAEQTGSGLSASSTMLFGGPGPSSIRHGLQGIECRGRYGPLPAPPPPKVFFVLRPGRWRGHRVNVIQAYREPRPIVCKSSAY